ncbi:polysaccharide biosynthesis protein [Vibrio harveyi]|uniref:lipopolysaccharide biosynthesis protein n=1 Tax=Vibrio harveyi TaxID=669 RepID=UPI000D787B34|nr:oligosaccharide flippase family protein [Vibrio harveyi]GBK99348.1 polysaccharide biosynthesis protein [Vibrio harveyi]
MIKKSAIYLVSNIANSAIPFLLLPVLTRTLSQEEYGEVAIFQTLLFALNSVVGISAHGLANRKYFENINRKELAMFYGDCFYVLLASTGVCFILTLFFGGWISGIIGIKLQFLYIGIVVSLFNFIVQFKLNIYQVQSKALNFGILQISKSLLNVIFSLVLVVSYGLGSEGRIDAQMYSSAFFAIFVIAIFIRDKKIILSKPKYVREIVSFGVPLIPHLFGFFLINSLDRIVISNELGMTYAGIYMVAVQFSLAIHIIFDAQNKALVPWLFAKLEKNNSKDKRRIVCLTYKYFGLLVLVAILCFIVVPYVVLLVAGSGYEESASIVGYLCLGQIFNGMYLMVTNYIFFAKRTGVLSLVTVSSGILNIILLLFLVEQYGINGAAYSFVISKMCQFLGTWLLASKVYDMPWINYKYE